MRCKSTYQVGRWIDRSAEGSGTGIKSYEFSHCSQKSLAINHLCDCVGDSEMHCAAQWCVANPPTKMVGGLTGQTKGPVMDQIV